LGQFPLLACPRVAEQAIPVVQNFQGPPPKILLEQPIALKFGMQVGWVLVLGASYTSPSESPSFRSRTGFSADFGAFFDFSSVRQGYSSHGKSSGAETSAIVAL